MRLYYAIIILYYTDEKSRAKTFSVLCPKMSNLCSSGSSRKAVVSGSFGPLGAWSQLCVPYELHSMLVCPVLFPVGKTECMMSSKRQLKTISLPSWARSLLSSPIQAWSFQPSCWCCKLAGAALLHGNLPSQFTPPCQVIPSCLLSLVLLSLVS